MERSGGNQSRAAGMLGITRATLRKKLRLFGLTAA
jgi:DNA-binding protein Fis